MGSIAYQFVRYLYERGWLERAIVAYTAEHDLPNSKVIHFPWLGPVARLARDNAPLRDALFDRLSASYLVDCDIFHGWSHQCLSALRRARELGAVTFVERQNSHDHNQQRLLREEYRHWGYDGAPPVRPWGMRRGIEEYDSADFITVPSVYAYDSMITEGIREEKVFLNPYGVDVKRFTPAAEEPGGFRLLFVGQICLRKGIPYLLQAWKELKLGDAELWLAGRVKPDARDVVSEMANSPSIRILGHVADPAPLYRKASAFVLPSIDEGSALVTYEAMACGLPLVFTYNCGAVARDGIEGIQVPIRNPDALAEAIERLYQDPDLRRSLGKAGRERAELYTWEAAGERLTAIYKKALE